MQVIKLKPIWFVIFYTILHFLIDCICAFEIFLFGNTFWFLFIFVGILISRWIYWSPGLPVLKSLKNTLNQRLKYAGSIYFFDYLLINSFILQYSLLD